MSDERRQVHQLGAFELVELLEEDVMGSLYKARDTRTNQDVLLKVVAPSVSHNPALRRYIYDKWADRREMVEHPNVLNVLEAGREGSRHYVAIEDTGGERLSAKLTDAPLPLDDALDIVRQVAEGLRAAHRRDVVHGHLKPSDIVLTTDHAGRRLVKVVFFDLGVCATDSVVSVFGEVVGAPKYMAPEVIRGRLPDQQADVFALGVLAYELLTGREPFPSEHAMGYLFANCEDEATPADEVRQDLPHEVALVVGRMLAKEPRHRYRSMQRVIDDLVRCDQCIKTGHVEVVPHGTDSAFARDYELPEPGTRRAAQGARGVRVLTALLLVVLVGLAGYFVGSGLPAWWRGRLGGRPREGAGRGGGGGRGAVSRREGGGRVEPVEPLGPVEPSGPPPRRPPTPVEPAPPPAAEETPAQRAFEKAAADWQRYSRREDYELGIAAFSSVVRAHPDTPEAARSREEMARIYTEWARAGAEGGDLAGAVERYGKALELAAEDSAVAQVARRAMPGAMARLADALRTRGDYEQAIAAYERIARDFPGTKEAALLEVERPRIMFNQAFMLWKDRGEHDEAISGLLSIVKDYAGTEWAERARQAMPALYLDAVRQKLDHGQLEQGRRQLQELIRSYPQHSAAAEAAELDAEVLFRWVRENDEAGNAELRDRHYAELLVAHPDSRWAVEAARIVLGLDRSEGDLFDSSTARNEMKKARAQYEQFDFAGGMATLRGVLRYARADSPEATEALATLPRWLYESGLYAYGEGSPGRCRAAMERLSEEFPGTDRDRAGAETLRRIEEPPEGMVYVPEGRFLMGTQTDEMLALLRLHVPGELSEDEEGIKVFADLAGLLSETPQHVATTGAFYIARTEVTNEQYKEFVDATRMPPPAHWRDGTYPEGEANLPVVNVSLSEATAYAKWRGARLPNEQEWEKAARGVDGRTFPWGAVFETKCCHHMRPESAGPATVGLYPTWGSPYGCLDMIGNVREWTSSTPDPYPNSEWQGSPDPEGQAVARGGAWFQEELAPIPARCASRYVVDAAKPDKATGFRCVVPAPQEPLVAKPE